METDQTELQEIVNKINELKHARVQDTVVPIEDSFLRDLDWLLEIVQFTKSFVSCTYNLNESPIQTIDTVSYSIAGEHPFLQYKDDIKLRYQNVVDLMKGVYKNALKLPDVEKINDTINYEFHNRDHTYLRNPEILFDNFVQNVNSYTHIQDNYALSTQCINTFQYLYYKLLNHITELEFDADSSKI